MNNYDNEADDQIQNYNFDNPYDELALIDSTLEHLEITMNQYLDDVHQIWELEFIPFLNSPECMVFKYLGEHDFKKFLNFMLTQDTFKLIKIAQSRLKKRRMILIRILWPYTNKSTQTRSENGCE